MGWGWIKSHEDDEVLNFLKSHEGKHADEILLKVPRIAPWSRDYIFSQANGKKSFERKFPSFKGVEGLIIPPKKAIEQASSEISSKYKATFCKGKKMLDLSMGMGSDLFFLGSSFELALGIELSGELRDIVDYNFSVIGGEKYRTEQGNGLEFLDNYEEQVDLIYVDPDRRNTSGRVFRFGDSEPNLVGKISSMLKKGKRVLVKSSPMLDLDFGIRELGNPASIRIISIGQECKELLFEFSQRQSEVTVLYLDWFSKGKWESHSFPIKDINSGRSNFGSLENFIFDPNPSFTKARAFAQISEQFELKKISRNTHLYTGKEENSKFPGRVFKVLESGDSKGLANFKGMAFEILMRNFPSEKGAIIKKYKLKEGSGDILFLFSDLKGQKKWARCEPV